MTWLYKIFYWLKGRETALQKQRFMHKKIIGFECCNKVSSRLLSSSFYMVKK